MRRARDSATSRQGMGGGENSVYDLLPSVAREEMRLCLKRRGRNQDSRGVYVAERSSFGKSVRMRRPAAIMQPYIDGGCNGILL